MEDFERAAYEGQRKRAHNRYMDAGLNRRFSAQKAGDPFDFPETPDELELMVGWFFDRLRVIVSIENHTQKFDGVRQLLDILQDAATITRSKVKFAWVDGQWFITDYRDADDILNLPKLLKVFSKIYRHYASDYVYGDQESIHFLPNGETGHLSTKEAEEAKRQRETGV